MGNENPGDTQPDRLPEDQRTGDEPNPSGSGSPPKGEPPRPARSYARP